MQASQAEEELYFSALRAQLCQAETLSFCEVSLEGVQPQPRDCHGNVDRYVKLNPQ